MQRDNVIAALRRMMKQSSEAGIDWDGVDEESEIASLGFDSLSILDFIYDIQQEFGLDFDAQDLADVRTVRELVDFLAGKAPS